MTAPDLPGFGFTEVPSSSPAFAYTFANLAATVREFLAAVEISSYAVYIFDYGSPTALRVALLDEEEKEKGGSGSGDGVKAIVSQNGNAYEDGLVPFWDPIRKLWAAEAGSDDEKEIREQLAGAILTAETTKWQYTEGEAAPESIDPASWTLDQALLERPGQRDIQLDLFKDYGTNVALYPKFQEYFRKTQVPMLAVWGKNDQFFGPGGAEAFKRDLKNVQVELWDAGHFLAESHTVQLAERMLKFFEEVGFAPS